VGQRRTRTESAQIVSASSREEKKVKKVRKNLDIVAAPCYIIDVIRRKMMKKPPPFKEDTLLHFYIVIGALPLWVLAVSEFILWAQYGGQ
jgi:hypothetical protein